MKHKFVLAVYLFFAVSYMQAQPAIEWQRCFGGTAYDVAYSLRQTSDGGYIVVGYSESNNGDVTGNHGGEDYWIVKLNINGSIQWQKSFGGSNYELAYSVQQTTDGGYIVVGYSRSNDGNVTSNQGSWDYWIVKLNSSGNIQWQKSFGGSNYDAAYSVQQTTDGGYIVAGYSYSNDGDVIGHHGSSQYCDFWIVKLDSAGSMQWQKSMGGSGDDGISSIQQTTDGGYIVAGTSASNDGDVIGHHGSADSSDCWIVKLDSTGGMLWQKCLGGTSDDEANSIQQTPDGGYIVVGHSLSINGDVTGNHGSWDYWIVKLSSTGSIQWQKCLGGSDDDEARSIQQTNDGGYVIVGFSYSNDDDVTGHHGNNQYEDYWIVKIDSIGNIQWQKCLGGSNYDAAFSIQQTIDDGYVVGGYSASNDGDVSGNHGSDDFWIVKLSPYTGINEADANENIFHIYPNPFTSSSTLQLNAPIKNAEVVIYDMVGKEMMRKKLNGEKMEIKRGNLESGVYIVSVVSEEGVWMEKMVVE